MVKEKNGASHKTNRFPYEIKRPSTKLKKKKKETKNSYFVFQLTTQQELYRASDIQGLFTKEHAKDHHLLLHVWINYHHNVEYPSYKITSESKNLILLFIMKR
jgi:hypothetical protein